MMNYSKLLIFICTLSFTTVQAWEIPAFLLDSLPSYKVDFTPIDNRELQPSGGVMKKNDNSSGTTVVQPHAKDDNDDMPTEYPTESPAPSPSPSEIPTESPTITAKPTPGPTEMPTESPAPSPAPSEMPTFAPSDSPSASPSAAPSISSMPSQSPSSTPSDAPSSQPSSPPTEYPTVSAAPSDAPSEQPSSFPSSAPSISSAPSLWPSAAPSISAQPSSSPTHIMTVTANIPLTLPIESGLLNETQLIAMQVAMELFIDQVVTTPGAKLEQITATLSSQKVVEITAPDTEGNYNRRKLELWSGLNLEQALEVVLAISANYIGPDMSFDLKDTVTTAIETNTDQLYSLLAVNDKVFLPLAPTAVADENSGGGTVSSAVEKNAAGETTKDDGGISGGAVATVSLLAAAAIGLALIASIYAVRSYRRANHGRELLMSPINGGLGTTHIGSKIYNENLEQYQLELARQQNGLFSNSYEEEGVEQDIMRENSKSARRSESLPVSPNSLEKGGSSMKSFNEIVPTADERKNSWSRTTTRSSSSENNKVKRSISINESRSKDPPSAESMANFALEPSSRDMPVVSLMDNNTEVSEMTRSRYSANGHEVVLTKSTGGHLGAAPVAASNAASGFGGSDFSDHAESFFGAAESRDEDGANGRSQDQDDQQRLQQQSSYDNSTMRKGGMYDVFAPAGPIGIVVDTTKHGPAVHSLKRTSPMLGLINPGDLIVGLDDEDTRGMTAATLTRLMAKKSMQKERKITLLTADY